ncbi:hypothetical protein B0H14DRAFT_2519685 [Mycena olivaceomarginata]|nr:hypothetical protein B0H14DRAFT_2519685 [Mycena olivaceomarginata]
MWCANETTALTHAKCAAKERALTKWTERWKKTYPTGRFTAADRIPPAWKPKPHFTNTKREVYGQLVQCRTGHAFIGEYDAKFVPLERIACQCGERYQTREHILQECEKYEQQRDLLRDASAELSLPDILGTEKGLQALAKFLEVSGVFTKTGQPRQTTEPLVPEDEEDASAT